MVFCHTNFHGHPSVEGDVFFWFFRNSNRFGAFSHSKGFGAETQVQPRFHQGFTKVPPRFHRYLSGLQTADPFWGAKRFCGRFPHHFFTLVSQFPNSFCSFLHLSPTALALGSSAVVKVFGQNGAGGSLQQMAFASQKVLSSVPQTVFCIGLTVSCVFFGNWLLLQKRFCGGFRQQFFTLVSQMAFAS